MMLLAEINPPVGYATWLACVAFTVVLVNGVFKLWDRVTGNAQKRDVKLVNEYLTRNDLVAIVKDIARHETEIAEFKDAVEKMQEKSDESRRKLWRRTDRMNGLLQRIAGKLDVHCEDHTAEDNE